MKFFFVCKLTTIIAILGNIFQKNEKINIVGIVIELS